MSVKGCCDLFMHGAIESATPNVHGTFNTALNDALCMQSDIYTEMSNKGWYQNDTAPEQKLQQTKQKYNSVC